MSKPEKIKVLMVASEAYPLIKTGGLADVIGSLPKALNAQGLDVRVILPKYSDIGEAWLAKATLLARASVRLAWREVYCGIESLKIGGVTFYLIDNEYYFKRRGIYGHYDEAERFAFFCQAVLQMLPAMEFKPDILHCHDWQASLVPIYLKTHYANNVFYQDMRTILTIHNLKYQGIFGSEVLADVLGLDEKLLTDGTLEFHGDINELKGGIQFADLISTVSKTYAQEIKTAYYGERLEGVLARVGHIYGIINGIDQAQFNPKTDPALSFSYSQAGEDKTANKLEVQEQLSLAQDKDIPILAFISRLVEQKGLDLIIPIISSLMEEKVQVVFLGSGEKKYEDALRALASQYPDKLSVNLYYDEEVAHKLYAGSDMMLMPSKYEPCGLTQLIAMRYGSIPIVRETGGLKDTVRAFQADNLQGTGFTFYAYNAHELLAAIHRALETFEDKKAWQVLVNNAMGADHSWQHSASKYVSMYRKLLS